MKIGESKSEISF